MRRCGVSVVCRMRDRETDDIRGDEQRRTEVIAAATETVCMIPHHLHPPESGFWVRENRDVSPLTKHRGAEALACIRYQSK